MSIDKYSEQIVINSSTISVGGVEIPGCISADIKVTQDSEIDDHWTLELTLMTGKPPRFEDGVMPAGARIVRPGGEPA